MTNLDQMKDDEGKPFTPAAQRACLLLRQLRNVRQAPKIPIVLVEPNEVPSFVAKELEAREQQHRPRLDITLIGSKHLDTGSFRVSTPSDYTESEHHLSLLGSDIIIIGSDAYHRMAEYIPPYAVFRPGRYELSAISKSRTNRLDDLPDYDTHRGPASLGTEELNHDWSHEVSWRLNRAYELKVSKNQKQEKIGNPKLINCFQFHKTLSSELRKYGASLYRRCWSVCKTVLLRGVEKSCFQRRR